MIRYHAVSRLSFPPYAMRVLGSWELSKQSVEDSYSLHQIQINRIKPTVTFFQCELMLMNFPDAIKAGFAGCFVKSFSPDPASMPTTTAATTTTTAAAGAGQATGSTTTTAAGLTLTTLTTLAPVTLTTLTTLTPVTLTTLTTLTLTTLTTLKVPLVRKKRQATPTSTALIADVTLSFSSGISNVTLDQIVTNATSGNVTTNITGFDSAISISVSA